MFINEFHLEDLVKNLSPEKLKESIEFFRITNPEKASEMERQIKEYNSNLLNPELNDIQVEDLHEIPSTLNNSREPKIIDSTIEIVAPIVLKGKNNISKTGKKNVNVSKDADSIFSNAFDLYNKNTVEIPKLLNPFLQKVGLASLVGTSDSGKSTFLRQLSLAIVLKLDTFLGFKIEATTNKVLYVSTEDDANAVSFAIKKQVDYLIIDNATDPSEDKIDLDLKLLSNLEFMFETDFLLEKISEKLELEPVDLIVIDAFTDVFTKELNANIQVRQFLNEYDQLAKKHGCLILFLHHIGKNTLRSAPSKDSIIGSQAFEAKMRVVLELRPNRFKSNHKDLWVLKANFLDASFKTKSHEIKMNNDLIFTATGERSEKTQTSKSANPLLKDKVLELKSQGLSYRKIEDALKGTDLEIGKSAIAELVKKNTSSKG